MKKSQHAEARERQRGIRKEEVELLLTFGKPERKPGGAFEYKMSRRDASKVVQHYKRKLQLIDKAQKKAVLVSSDEVIITVYALA